MPEEQVQPAQPAVGDAIALGRPEQPTCRCSCCCTCGGRGSLLARGQEGSRPDDISHATMYVPARASLAVACRSVGRLALAQPPASAMPTLALRCSTPVPALTPPQ